MEKTKMKKFITWAVVLIVLAGLVYLVKSAGCPDPVTVTVNVVDSNTQPVGGVNVQLEQASAVTTDEQGIATIPFEACKDDTLTVVASKDGQSDTVEYVVTKEDMKAKEFTIPVVIEAKATLEILTPQGEGFEVTIDESVRGVTTLAPFTARVTSNEDVKVEIKKQGYYDYDTTMEVLPPPNITRLEAKLQPVDTTPSLYITSSPRGASVKVDGRARGTAPVKIKDLNFQTYTIEATMEGTTQRKQVELTAENKAQNVSFFFPWGDLTISSKPGNAIVFIDDVQLQKTTPVTKRVSTGMHNIVVQYNGSRIEDTVYVNREKIFKPYKFEVPKAETPTITPVEKCAVTVYTDTLGATISVNGESKGKTGKKGVKMKLPYGSYTFVAEWGGIRKDTPVTLSTPKKEFVITKPLPPPPNGTLNVDTRPANMKATVTVDGVEKGQTPFTQEIPLGSHSVVVTSRGMSSCTFNITLDERNRELTRICDMDECADALNEAASLFNQFPANKRANSSQIVDLLRDCDESTLGTDGYRKALYYMSVSLYYLNDYKRAMEKLTMLRDQLDPANPLVYYYIALILEAQAQYSLAIENYNRVMEFAPGLSQKEQENILSKTEFGLCFCRYSLWKLKQGTETEEEQSLNEKATTECTEYVEKWRKKAPQPRELPRGEDYLEELK